MVIPVRSDSDTVPLTATKLFVIDPYFESVPPQSDKNIPFEAFGTKTLFFSMPK